MATVPALRCGVSGWSYPDWDGVVYPKPRPRSFHPLELLCEYFDTVLVDPEPGRNLRPEVSKFWIHRVASNRQFAFCLALDRRFTEERLLDPGEVASWKQGVWPFLRAGRLGFLLLRFPSAFRFTPENREFLIQLRRTFPEFPLVAEMRHRSWMLEEALGTLVDYRVGFGNLDQPPSVRAMPPTGFLTSPVGCVRLEGRSRDWLYTPAELSEWKNRIDRIQPHATTTYVIAANASRGRAVLNALQLQAMLGLSRHSPPRELLRAYRRDAIRFEEEPTRQQSLFPKGLAVA